MPDFAALLGGLSIRAGARGDGAPVSDLFARAEPEIPLDAASYREMWDWLHFRNPVAPSDVLVAEDAAGRLEGHVAMLPVAFRAAGARVVAGWPCQLMVDEGLRRSLLYPAMVQRLLRLCGPGTYEFAYALINRPRVLKANIALGLKPIGRVPIWARPYRPSAILGKLAGGRRGAAAALLARPADLPFRLRLPHRASGISVEEIGAFDPEIDALFAQTLVPAFRYVAERSARTLNWRFFGLPERAYRVFVARAGGRIAGYVAFRTMPMRQFTALGVADLWHDPAVPGAGYSLMAEVHRAAVARRVDLAACLMPHHSPMTRLLRRSGFLETPESFTLTVYQPHRDLPFGRSALADWHPTWYDHDYV